MIKKVCLFIITIFTIFSMSSCVFSPKANYEFIENGDYIYAYNKLKGFEVSDLYLYGLTDSGKEKDYLILPEKYKDKKIDRFGIEYPLFMAGRDFKDEFSSDILKKVFIDFKLKYHDFTNSSKNEDGNTYTFVLWYDYDWESINQYSPRISHAVIGNNLFDDYSLDRPIQGEYYKRITNYIANVSYQYNYEVAPNDGYYWVDNYDNALIEYIPPEPMRVGYKFGGWYKEAECINKWNFEKDKTGNVYEYYEKPNEHSSKEYINEYEHYVNTHTYFETKLYAKWVKT